MGNPKLENMRSQFQIRKKNTNKKAGMFSNWMSKLKNHILNKYDVILLMKNQNLNLDIQKWKSDITTQI